MAKYGNAFYLELSREIFTEKYKHLSNNTKWLYVVLNELEQKYTGKGKNYFHRSDIELAKDAGMSLSVFKRAKKELGATDLIEITKRHWVIDADIGKLSKDRITCYEIC